MNFTRIMYFSELTQIVADVIYDPTLPKTEDHPCKKCGHNQAVFFQAQSRRAEVYFLLISLFNVHCLGRNATVLCMCQLQLLSSVDRMISLLFLAGVVYRIPNTF